jgi:caffeoyl-CoA O-methyltransferase
MSFIVPEELERYAEGAHDPASRASAAAGRRDQGDARAPADAHRDIEGRFLEFLVYMTGARRILEIGTYSGYSSAVLPQGGQIDTCEVEEEHAEVARRYIEEAGYADRISVHLGPALDTIGRLEGEFDLVFIDSDKENYVNDYEAVCPGSRRAA